MEFSLNTIKPFLLYQFSSEQELVDSIEEISHKFNYERDQIGDYVAKEKLVAAYTCFYGLTNIPKFKQVWSRINGPDLAAYEVIDIGSGPGTFSLALLEHTQPRAVYLLEKSELMRRQAKQLIEGIFPQKEVKIFEDVRSIPGKESKRLGLFGHSANEMTVEQILLLVKKLDLDEVLFIEPGTTEYFTKATKVREQLIKMEYRVEFPCPSQKACPLAEKDDWCHQYLELKHSHEVERLCQLTRKDRRRVPILLHYFNRSGESERDTFRVVRRYKPLKYALPFQVCSGKNELTKIEVLYKCLSKSQKKKLESVLAGDTIEFSEEKVLADGTKRVIWKITY